MFNSSFCNKNYIPKLLSVYSLGNIVKTAEYLRTEKDKKNRKHIKAILILKNITEVNDIKYNIEVIIRETNEGRLFYDHTLLDIKKKAENV